ncbi:GIY-YIG nuclease family protein [Streptomyces sp. NBC_01455]|uniref:GIY-YIG nuclease family protein n=1 Tax=Streptomyces sp. NBC_01455 TaxID=2903874 RepID=UPI003FCD0A93
MHNCSKNQGVYVFNDLTKPGHVYVGKTNDFNVRLAKHIQLGRLADKGDAICVHVCGDDTNLRITEHIFKDQFQKMGIKLSSGIEGYGRNLYNTRRAAVQMELPLE